MVGSESIRIGMFCIFKFGTYVAFCISMQWNNLLKFETSDKSKMEGRHFGCKFGKYKNIF